MKGAILLLLAASAMSMPTNEDISPAFDAIRDVAFLVYTRTNPTLYQQVDIDNMDTVRASNYDQTRPTRVIIHGWTGDRMNPTNTLLVPAFLAAGDFSKLS